MASTVNGDSLSRGQTTSSRREKARKITGWSGVQKEARSLTSTPQPDLERIRKAIEADTEREVGASASSNFVTRPLADDEIDAGPQQRLL